MRSADYLDLCEPRFGTSERVAVRLPVPVTAATIVVRRLCVPLRLEDKNGCAAVL